MTLVISLVEGITSLGEQLMLHSKVSTVDLYGNMKNENSFVERPSPRIFRLAAKKSDEPLPTTDLRVIIARVRKENPTWSEERLFVAEKQYREFWASSKETPSKGYRIPSDDADKIWHQHILTMKKYERDCHDYFGYLLYHEPFTEEEVVIHRMLDGGDCRSGDCQGASCRVGGNCGGRS